MKSIVVQFCFFWIKIMLENRAYFHIWFCVGICVSYWPSLVCPCKILGKYVLLAALVLHLVNDLHFSAKHMFARSATALDTTSNQQDSDGPHKKVPQDQPKKLSPTRQCGVNQQYL